MASLRAERRDLEDRVREQSEIIRGLSETSEHLQESVASSGARWEDETRALRERLAESETQKAALRTDLDRALAAAKDTRALLPDALAEARVEWEAERAEDYQFEVNFAAASAAGAFASEHTDVLHAHHEVEGAHRVELSALKERLEREADARVAALVAEHTLAIQEHLDARALDAQRAIAAQQTSEARVDAAIATTEKVLTAQHAATIEAASEADARHFNAVATLESTLSSQKKAHARESALKLAADDADAVRIEAAQAQFTSRLRAADAGEAAQRDALRALEARVAQELASHEDAIAALVATEAAGHRVDAAARLWRRDSSEATDEEQAAKRRELAAAALHA